MTINIGSFPPMNVDRIINHFYVNRLTVLQKTFILNLLLTTSVIKEGKAPTLGIFGHYIIIILLGSNLILTRYIYTDPKHKLCFESNEF